MPHDSIRKRLASRSGLTSKHAVAIRRADDSLALLLRVVRAPSGIYVVFAAGQTRASHDPHSSWHRDGRVHQKSFGHAFMRRKGQALEHFTGVELFIQTSATRADARYLPDCNPTEFDSVVDVPAQLLGQAPTGTNVRVELVGRDAEPTVLGPWAQLRQRAVFAEGIPAIVVSLYDIEIPS